LLMGNDAGLFCVECGCANPQHARFCRFCGHPVHPAPDHVPLSAQDASSSAQIAVVSQPEPATSSHPAQVGRLLKQRYRIVKQVGAGGYGKVYRAIDTEFMDRRVAVKEMIQQGLNSVEVMEASQSFKREAVLLATLTHPNLPSIYDYFSENGNWYLVMSFIEGETLDSYMQKRAPNLSVEKVLPIAIQLATVLSFLHTRKPMIIFRDLKPTNVMRTPEGQLYLIDFGIARHFKWGQTKDTLILGSPGYAAPEQYGRAQTTPQTDVYSLGVLLHQLLTGLDPALTPFRHPKINLPDYPQLGILIHCMLDMDAKKRPASMGNIQRELQRISTGRVHGTHTTHHQAQVQRRFFRAATPMPPQIPQVVAANLPPIATSIWGTIYQSKPATSEQAQVLPLVPSVAPTFADSQVPGQKIWTKLNAVGTILSQVVKLP
jgi:serine/threonine protein kinase